MLTPLTVASLGRDILLSMTAEGFPTEKGRIGGTARVFLRGWLRVPEAIDLLAVRTDFQNRFASQLISDASQFQLVQRRTDAIVLSFKKTPVRIIAVVPVSTSFAGPL